ncbi:MAG: DUF2905 domain-containing protein [Candidatus Omnitrophica bacterium]|jgi:uncharacterized protein HemY|nr:DUF2905 domain-containing protein [Candidatus Omnitrophota bacterium]
MANLYKLFILSGLILILIGFFLFLSNKFNIPIGRLPGDILIKKENFYFYFPLTSCVLISIFLFVVFYLFRSK